MANEMGLRVVFYELIRILVYFGKRLELIMYINNKYCLFLIIFFVGIVILGCEIKFEIYCFNDRVKDVVGREGCLYKILFYK